MFNTLFEHSLAIISGSFKFGGHLVGSGLKRYLTSRSGKLPCSYDMLQQRNDHLRNKLGV